MMDTRKETDPLGEKNIPKNAYYGIQTLRATENFPVSGIKAPPVFIKAYVLVKKAAALANTQVSWLDPKMGKAIVQACDEILAGIHGVHNYFVNFSEEEMSAPSLTVLESVGLQPPAGGGIFLIMAIMIGSFVIGWMQRCGS